MIFLSFSNIVHADRHTTNLRDKYSFLILQFKNLILFHPHPQILGVCLLKPFYLDGIDSTKPFPILPCKLKDRIKLPFALSSPYHFPKRLLWPHYWEGDQVNLSITHLPFQAFPIFAQLLFCY